MFAEELCQRWGLNVFLHNLVYRTSIGGHCMGANMFCCREPGGSDVMNCVNSCKFIPAGVKKPSKSEGQGLPQYLRSLYEKSVAHLDIQQVVEVLNEFADTSKGPHDLGKTDLVKHQINTGNAAPIHQPLQRLPFAKKDEAE